MNDQPCTWQEGCPCPACVKERAAFDKWADDFDRRWAAHVRANEELAAELAAIVKETALTEPSGLVLS